ncbi:hypothetical protein PENTCL1PPCAC_27207, partial [Pristionchus entomophagus]
GDVPSVNETDKSTVSILFQRVRSITGITKTKENKALKLKVDQLTKEGEERKGEINRYRVS